MADNFKISSSISDDIWHRKESPKAYEWWYFDALSDDGRDALVIIFLDNFVFSPNYNSSDTPHFPAISFTFYRDGKPLYRAINEFNPEDFSASPSVPFCRIGENEMSFKRMPYGSGYSISIDANLFKGRRLKASFEWLAIESDFLPEERNGSAPAHYWNLACPRADVTGHVEVFRRNGKLLDKLQFRGSGYHDHNSDTRWMPDAIESWQWGRCHYADATAAFYRYKEKDNNEAATKLFIIRDGEFKIRDADYEEQNFSRDIFGLKYPQRITLTTESNVRLRVKQLKVIDSSFFYLRFLSEITLTIRDGKPRKMTGITESLSPKALKFRWLDWLVNMRIGRKGKGSFLP